MLPPPNPTFFLASVYESIAEKFPESARAVLNNLLEQAEEVGGGGGGGGAAQ